MKKRSNIRKIFVLMLVTTLVSLTSFSVLADPYTGPPNVPCGSISVGYPDYRAMGVDLNGDYVADFYIASSGNIYVDTNGDGTANIKILPDGTVIDLETGFEIEDFIIWNDDGTMWALPLVGGSVLIWHRIGYHGFLIDYGGDGICEYVIFPPLYSCAPLVMNFIHRRMLWN